MYTSSVVVLKINMQYIQNSFIGYSLVFVGKLMAIRGVWVIIGYNRLKVNGVMDRY